MNNVQQYKHRNGLTIEETGSGPRVVFVHGGGLGGSLAWKAQVAWADKFRLVMPFRAAYGPSPLTTHEDFEQDAELVSDLLEGGAHLIGHSYGGVVALMAAAKRPQDVRSLTLIEPGSTSVARGNPDVDSFEAKLAALAADPPPEPDAHLRALIGILDPSGHLPNPLLPPLTSFAARLHLLRGTNDAVIPMDQLRAAHIPTLIISGGHSPVFDAVAEALARQLPGELATFPHQGHVPHWNSDVVNRRMRAFLDSFEIVQAAVRFLEDGWNKADGAMFASPFAEDADFVAIRGDRHRGKATIALGHDALFSSIYKSSTVKYQVTDARQVTPGVIVGHLQSILRVPAGPVAGVHSAVATVALVAAQNDWRITAFHNTLVAEPGPLAR